MTDTQVANLPKEFDQLGELYIGTLISNAHHHGAASSIAQAVLAGFDNLVNWDFSDGARREHCVEASRVLTSRAMGILQAANGTLDRDWRDRRRDWARVDRFGETRFDSPEAEANEAVWLFDQLTRASAKAWDDYAVHCQADWARDFVDGAQLLSAAAELIQEAFQIREVTS